MKLRIACPCGYEIHAEEQSEVVAKAQEHARSVHGMELSEEDALAMAKPADV